MVSDKIDFYGYPRTMPQHVVAAKRPTAGTNVTLNPRPQFVRITLWALAGHAIDD
jgi:hypothetical protein